MPVIETKGAASSGGFGQFARQVAANYIEDVFSTFLYTGTDAVQTITNGIDLAGKGGMVWVKSRNFGDAANVPCLFDTVRGPRSILMSNSTSSADVFGQDALTATSSGFTLSSDPSNYGFNNNGSNQVSWTFRKQAKFFDIVTYIGNGSSSRLINHSLGSAPGLVIIKATSTTSNWPVMFAPTSGNAYGFSNGYVGGGLNTNGAGYSLGSVSGVSTETQFRVGSSYWGAGSQTNDSGVTYIAYVFANNAGGFGASGTENAITCGTYTGNGSTTGPIITLGYEPQFLLIKNRESGTYEDWVMVDTVRGLPVNGPAALLYADLANSEASTNPFINVSATGFQPVVSSSRINASGNNYMYMAIRRGPMRTPTSGTSVFEAYAGNAGTVRQFYFDGALGEQSAAIVRSRTGTEPFIVADRLRGLTQGSSTSNSLYLKTTSADSESSTPPGSSSIYAFSGTGAGDIRAINTSTTWIGYAFRRAPGFFDVVCWTGNATARTINHNLQVAPEFIIAKARSTNTSWSVYHSGIGASNYLIVNSTQAQASNPMWNNTTPSASVFFVDSGYNNFSGVNYVGYLFASCPGVSKVGSYTGTGVGTTQQINCGFTGGARFVLIKRTTAAGDWYVWDSARGIVAGNDPYLFLNSTAAEVTNTDYIDTYSAGFEISSTAPADLNNSGNTYVYLAIA